MTRKERLKTADGCLPLLRFPWNPGKGGGEMVTYDNLFTYTLVIVAVITLVLAIIRGGK